MNCLSSEHKSQRALRNAPSLRGTKDAGRRHGLTWRQQRGRTCGGNCLFASVDWTFSVLHHCFHTGKPKLKLYWSRIDFSKQAGWPKVCSSGGGVGGGVSKVCFSVLPSSASQLITDTYSFVGLHSWWPQRGGSIPERSSPSLVHCGPAAGGHTL